MSKKFVIMEVTKRLGQETFEPTIPVEADATIIDPRHVIDGERLRMGIPQIGETYFSPGFGGWVNASGQFVVEPLLILDPPKEEDEWEKWLMECPYLDGETESQFEMRANFINWLRRMPRGK